MANINMDGLKDLTTNEAKTLRIALDERANRLSETLKTIEESDSMHEVYINSLVDINSILDKLFPVSID